MSPGLTHLVLSLNQSDLGSFACNQGTPDAYKAAWLMREGWLQRWHWARTRFQLWAQTTHRNPQTGQRLQPREETRWTSSLGFTTCYHENNDFLHVFRGLSHTGQPWLGTSTYCSCQGRWLRWKRVIYFSTRVSTSSWKEKKKKKSAKDLLCWHELLPKRSLSRPQRQKP